MNQDQVLSAIRWVVTTAGAYFVSRGAITGDQLELILGALGALVPLIWSFVAHTNGAKVLAAASIEGVKVAVSQDAPESVQKLAKDKTVKDVVVAK